MAKKEEKFQPHRILREVYRHYTEFEQLFRATGVHTIEHAVAINGEKYPVMISLFDLRDGLKSQEDGGVLSARKLQAVMLNVIADMKQRDVADIMNITTVSVGQYVEHAMEQLSRLYFPEYYNDDSGVLLDTEELIDA